MENMSVINKDGMLIDNRVVLRRFQNIEHGSLVGVRAIVIHQTDGSTAQHTFHSYNAGGNGAHFLIDKNGQIYQTASLRKRCYHVGRLIKSKCLTINKQSCKNANMANIIAMSWASQIKALDASERVKTYPDRYPVNSDSIGIELVGKHLNEEQYEIVTPSQNVSLQWLVRECYNHFGLTSNDVYKHPEVSYKNPGEASTAEWK